MQDKQTQALRKAVDEAKWTPLAKVVLDYLARQPATLRRFDDVAAAVGASRGDVEKAIAELRHPRNGAPLSNNAADGKKLKARWAFLPADSPIRALYPPIEHPPAPESPAAKGRPGRVGKNDVNAARKRFKDEREEIRKARRAERKKIRQKMHEQRAAKSASLRADRLKAREIFRKATRAGPTPVPNIPTKEEPPANAGTTRPTTTTTKAAKKNEGSDG